VHQLVSEPEQRTSSAAAICGRKQIGKTALLYEAWRRYQAGHPVALLDLEKANESSEVLRRLVRSLDERIPFDAYSALLKSMTPVRPTFDARTVEVRNRSTLNIVVDGAAQRHANAAQLGSQFIEDLRRYRGPRPLLMFDHYDRSAPAVQNWLDEDFLPDLTRVADTLLLLASEQAPADDVPPSSWQHAIREMVVLQLSPFTADDVAEWMAAMDLAENWDLAGFAAVSFDGMPGEIGAKLAAWSSNGGSRRP
jgi:hypothetical protein